MNSYTIYTFKLEDGTWEAKAYGDGRCIAETTAHNEPVAIVAIGKKIASDCYEKLGLSDW